MPMPRAIFLRLGMKKKAKSSSDNTYKLLLNMLFLCFPFHTQHQKNTSDHLMMKAAVIMTHD